MSTLVRMLFVSRGSRGRLAASTYFKFNLSSPVRNFVNSNCECKVVLSPLSSVVNYSTRAAVKRSENIRTENIEESIGENDTEALKSVKTEFIRENTRENVAEKLTNRVNEDGKEVIYTGFSSKRMRLVKLFSLSTSMIGLGVQPIIYQQAVLSGSTNQMILPVFAVIGLFALATPPLLHWVTKRYVISVEYNHLKDTYTATTYNLFCMRKKLEFTPEDVTIPTVLGMFTSCAIKGKRLFMDPKDFTDQAHYKRIMGYDKPIDFGLDDEESIEKCSKKKD